MSEMGIYVSAVHHEINYTTFLLNSSVKVSYNAYVNIYMQIMKLYMYIYTGRHTNPYAIHMEKEPFVLHNIKTDFYLD